MDPVTLSTMMAELTEHIYFDYGLAVLLLVVILIQVVPTIVKKGAPGLFSSWAKEADHRRDVEERTVSALEKLAEANHSIAVAMAKFDVRLDAHSRQLNRLEDKVDRVGKQHHAYSEE